MHLISSDKTGMHTEFEVGETSTVLLERRGCCLPVRLCLIPEITYSLLTGLILLSVPTSAFLKLNCALTKTCKSCSTCWWRNTIGQCHTMHHLHQYCTRIWEMFCCRYLVEQTKQTLDVIWMWVFWQQGQICKYVTLLVCDLWPFDLLITVDGWMFIAAHYHTVIGRHCLCV